MKKLMQKLMLDCDKATLLITKQQEHKLSFKKKIQLSIHLMACKFCRLFKKQSVFLSKNMDYLHCHLDECFSSTKLSNQKKITMKKKLQIKLNESLRKK